MMAIRVSSINLNTGLNTLTFDKNKVLTETVELTFSGTLNADCRIYC